MTRACLVAIVLTLSTAGGGRSWLASAAPPAIPPCIPGSRIPDAPNCYQLLDVPVTATTKQIKKAYRRRALDVHPDKCGANCGEEANKLFVDLAFAYETLGDETTRGRYERGGGEWAPRAADDDDESSSSSSIYASHSDAWARSQFDLARDPLLTARGWATLFCVVAVGVLGDRSLRAAEIRARRRRRSGDVAATAERGVRSAALAREGDERRRARAHVSGERQRREARRRELREAIHASWNAPRELSEVLSDANVANAGPKSAPRTLPQRVRVLIEETRAIAASSGKLATAAAKAAMRTSFAVDDDSRRRDDDAQALAREKVTGTDADAAMAAMVCAVRGRVTANAWESSVVGEETLRQALIGWGKDAAAKDREWTRRRRRDADGGVGGGGDGSASAAAADGGVAEELAALAESLREWGRLSREFGRLALELAAHARRCAAAVAAADRVRAAAEGGAVAAPWTKQEKATLKAAMAKYPKGHARRWEMVAREFEGSRTVDEIRRFVAEMIVAARNKDAVLGAVSRNP